MTAQNDMAVAVIAFVVAVAAWVSAVATGLCYLSP